MGTGVQRVGAIPRDETGELTCANKYAFGLALLRLPVMGPLSAANGDEVRSPAEDLANQLLSVLAGTLAVGLSVGAAMRLGAGRRTANAVAVAMAFGTGLFHYATYDSSFTHVYLAMLTAWFCWFAARVLSNRGDGVPVLSRAMKWDSGVAAFFFVAIRIPSIFPLFVGYAAIAVLLRVHQRDRTRQVMRLALPAAIGATAAVVLQVAYNRYGFGTWTLFSYRGEGLGTSGWHQWEVMFSARKGLFTWYPVLWLALAAMAVARRATSLLVTLAIVMPFVMLYGWWHSWYLGGSFGHRGFVDLVPVFAVALAVELSRLSVRTRRLWLGGAALATVYTLGLLVAYWNGDIDFGGATRQELWEHGVTSNDALDLLLP